jgi:hypothetical protein
MSSHTSESLNDLDEKKSIEPKEEKSSGSSIFTVLSVCMLCVRLFLHSNQSSNIDPQLAAQFSKIMEESAVKPVLVDPLRVKELSNELDKITENSYILFSKCGHFTDRVLCKVDRNKKNKIVLTKIDNVFTVANDWKGMDDIFNSRVTNAVDVTTNLKNLKKSVGTVYDANQLGYVDGFDVFGNGNLYFMQEIYLYKK